MTAVLLHSLQERKQLDVETRGLEWMWWGGTTEGYAGVRWHERVSRRLLSWLGIMRFDNSHLMVNVDLQLKRGENQSRKERKLSWKRSEKAMDTQVLALRHCNPSQLHSNLFRIRHYCKACFD